jgi:hypothetical protein
MSDITLFLLSSFVGLLTWLIIWLFKFLIGRGKKIRRSFFIITVTTFMTICGAGIGLAANSGLLLLLILVFSFLAWGAMISIISSFVILKNKP